MTMPTNDQAVEIREVTGYTIGGKLRALVVDGTALTAVEFPGNEYRETEWRIVAELGLAPARVYREEDARAWLEFLARNPARSS